MKSSGQKTRLSSLSVVWEVVLTKGDLPQSFRGTLTSNQP